MVSARVATAVLGVVASLAVSFVVWKVSGIAVFFLAVPFVPLLFRGRRDDPEPTNYECPECGFRTRDSEFAYCPRDGTRLQER